MTPLRPPCCRSWEWIHGSMWSLSDPLDGCHLNSICYHSLQQHQHIHWYRMLWKFLLQKLLPCNVQRLTMNYKCLANSYDLLLANSYILSASLLNQAEQHIFTWWKGIFHNRTLFCEEVSYLSASREVQFKDQGQSVGGKIWCGLTF